MKRNKKVVYRLLEYLYKTLMYPMLFLAMVRLMYWNPQVIHRNQLIEYASNLVAIGTVVVYVLVTVFQCLLENVSRLNRNENVVEFVSALAGAVILAGSLDK